MPVLNLVEGLARNERASEAELIHRSFGLLKKGPDQRLTRHVKTKLLQPFTKDEFMKALEAPCDYLHVSSHGKRIGGEGVIYVRNRARITAEDIRRLNIQASVIFVNACQAWSRDLYEAFELATGRRPAYYVAPANDVNFDEAYLVALLFYRGLILGKQNPISALKSAINIPGVEGAYLCRKFGLSKAKPRMNRIKADQTLLLRAR
ncbi:MAG: hypothetical protein QW767_05860 [Thermoprotei archaeon]